MHTDLSQTKRTIAACAFLSFPRPKQAPKHVFVLGVPLSLSLLPGGVAGVGLFEALLQLLFRVPSFPSRRRSVEEGQMKNSFFPSSSSFPRARLGDREVGNEKNAVLLSQIVHKCPHSVLP